MTTLQIIAAALIEAAREDLFNDSIAKCPDPEFGDYITEQIAQMAACTTLDDLAKVHFVASMAEKACDPNRYGEGIPTYGVEA